MKYTVIIPHRDIIRLLERCLDSIPRRDDIQVIVVDDNSRLDEAVWRDFRSRYAYVELCLTREGRGAGYARNVALPKARGEWVLFADADDFFYEGAFACFDEWAVSGHDIIYFQCDSRNSDTLALVENRLHYIHRYIASGDPEQLRYRWVVPWGKMIRRSLIVNAGLRFEEVETANDVMFSIRLGYAAGSLRLTCSEPLYCSTVRSDSLYFKKTIRGTICRVKVARRANVFFHKRGLDRYRIPIKFIDRFYPKHLILFVWGLWMFREDGNPIGNVKTLYKGIRAYLSNSVFSIVHK
jgi:glycosyltransferase involved in cell wall biosynthesis